MTRAIEKAGLIALDLRSFGSLGLACAPDGRLYTQIDGEGSVDDDDESGDLKKTVWPRLHIVVVDGIFWLLMMTGPWPVCIRQLNSEGLCCALHLCDEHFTWEGF